MNRLIVFVAILSIGVQCVSASDKGKSLTNYSSEQLKDCYSNPTICGARDSFEISNELTKRLPTLSTDQLVACFKDWKICGVENDIETGWSVSEEIARRGNPDNLLVRYWTERDISVRDGIVHVAYKFKSREVAEFMRRVLLTSKGDEDALYWPANYLAKKCDIDGLRWLSERKGRPEGCMLWAPTVALFGKCKYRPAIPYLLLNSLHDACLNIDDAAAEDLHKLYPGSPNSFESLEAARNYYRSRANQDGFKVDCSEN